MFKFACLASIALLSSQLLLAHNGKFAYAKPVTSIKIDGDMSDWPKNSTRYPISTSLSDDKPKDHDDFSGFFQIGYNLENQSLYLAFTITDNDFVEDTSENVRFNTQDGLELNVDARHLPAGSGVASFMYSKKLRNINNAYFDPFAKNANWDIMEVAMVRKGNMRYYEWKVKLGKELAVGKSIGLDFQCFDKDNDSTFTFTSWGKGPYKYRDPTSLGDIIPVSVEQKMGTIEGNITWDRESKSSLPSSVRLSSAQNKMLWMQVETDSSGHFKAQVPPGKYTLSLPNKYFIADNDIYSTAGLKPLSILVKQAQPAVVSTITIPHAAVPDLLPEKGLLLDFDAGAAKQIDQFIKTYQEYYGIPGVSFALIKDGRLVYNKTYGVRNAATGDKVDSNTLFEAASVTKPVFAFAVQRLAERGVIDLNKPLYLYLPYPDIAYDERYKLMTAKHVLTHRTGFPNWRYMNADNKLDLKFTPGTDYNYSGEGFEYLKMVVEKITGKNVEQVLKEEVLDPVGLYHTFFSRNDSLKRMVATGHFDMLPQFDELPEHPGMAYSMHTEAKIFTRFMLYMLEQKGLKAATYDSMFSKHSEFKFDSAEQKPRYESYMGMSLEIRETPFGKSFGHGGNNGDFKCHFEVYKDGKMGYAIFTNSNTADPLIDAMRELLVEGRDNRRDKKRQ